MTRGTALSPRNDRAGDCQGSFDVGRLRCLARQRRVASLSSGAGSDVRVGIARMARRGARLQELRRERTCGACPGGRLRKSGRDWDAEKSRDASCLMRFLCLLALLVSANETRASE